MKKLSVLFGMLLIIGMTSCEKDPIDTNGDGIDDTEQDGDVISTPYVDSEGKDISWVFGKDVILEHRLHGIMTFISNSDSATFQTKGNDIIGSGKDVKYRHLGDGKIEMKYNYMSKISQGVWDLFPVCDTLVVISSDITEGKLVIKWRNFVPGPTYFKSGYPTYYVDGYSSI